MTCESFDRWLDEGALDPGAAEARAHARTCTRCARALDAMLEIEAALANPPVAPAGFTDRVMARVAVTPQAAAPRAVIGMPAAPLLPPAFPWWVRIAMEPAVLLAAVVAALFVRFSAPVLGGAARVQVWLSHVEVSAHLPIDAPWTAALFLLPALAWASWQAYHWSASLTSRGAAAVRGSRTT